ncbi:hypothetical protein [Qipengyuania sp. ASV99]|uniref:hypothetical protein n=1 Tax=Qipengyuania sp. ASV99 TaxID=3399681 RepID=UPI003A4C6E32
MSDAQAKRRLTLASRQLTLAKIARRDAMAALANAVSEAARSEVLAQRSHELMRDYGGRPASSTGAGLRQESGFVRRLQEVAQQADQARKDTDLQAQWQAQSLAAAETRATRFEERMEAARRDIEARKANRELAHAPVMARKLLSSRRDTDEP